LTAKRYFAESRSVHTRQRIEQSGFARSAVAHYHCKVTLDDFHVEIVEHVLLHSAYGKGLA
jgi:hypothetical protein